MSVNDGRCQRIEQVTGRIPRQELVKVPSEPCIYEPVTGDEQRDVQAVTSVRLPERPANGQPGLPYAEPLELINQR
jgi:hypothetical protein